MMYPSGSVYRDVLILIGCLVLAALIYVIGASISESLK
jgi:hypothetical protein